MFNIMKISQCSMYLLLLVAIFDNNYTMQKSLNKTPQEIIKKQMENMILEHFTQKEVKEQDKISEIKKELFNDKLTKYVLGCIGVSIFNNLLGGVKKGLIKDQDSVEGLLGIEKLLSQTKVDEGKKEQFLGLAMTNFFEKESKKKVIDDIIDEYKEIFNYIIEKIQKLKEKCDKLIDEKKIILMYMEMEDKKLYISKAILDNWFKNIEVAKLKYVLNENEEEFLSNLASLEDQYVDLIIKSQNYDFLLQNNSIGITPIIFALLKEKRLSEDQKKQ